MPFNHNAMNKRRFSAKKTITVSLTDYQFLEFHRQAVALLPDPDDPRPGLAIITPGKRPGTEKRSCTCSGLSESNCLHVKRLAAIRDNYCKKLSCLNLEEDFKKSVWHKLAVCLGDNSDETLRTITLSHIGQNSSSRLMVTGNDGNDLVSYKGQGPDAQRLHERCRLTLHKDEVPHRGAALRRLRHLTLTDIEKMLLERGHESRRYALEGTFWFRFAYHCYREFGKDGFELRPSINRQTGDFMLSCLDDSGLNLFHLFVLGTRVKELLNNLRDHLPNQHRMPIHPVPLKTIFKISMNTELDLDIRPQIQMIQQGGENKFFERQDLERFRYGDLIYIKELGILAQLEPPDSKRRFSAPVRTVLKKHQIPAFMEELAEDGQDRYVLDESARSIRILKDTGELKITQDAIDRDWCWLSAQYIIGDTSVSLADILEARREDKRFINTKKGWVDCHSPRFDHLDKIFGSDVTKRIDGSKGQLKLSRIELLRLCAFEEGHIQGQEDNQRASLLKKFLDLIPLEKVSPPGGLTSPLREYQLRGMEWCFYLYKNGMGGLLCDDMGLGKTHQVMGLILLLLEKERIKAPFLVVCPTTVLSHWEKKIRIHAPSLRPIVYHGPERNLEKGLEENSVVLTSYGILWRDIAIFNKLHFTLAVFDEIQHIKNPSTKAYSAAKVLGAHMKLGLTGTPIENSLFELKALIDLTLPGYFETDKMFQERYVECSNKVLASRHEELSRLIAPITLRRIKDSVLDELPEKIEDIMTCRLSEQQIKLYKDAVSSKGRNLVDVLADSREPVPYMHIFAILNFLKQICNHPALVLKKTERYENYISGKWDLFKELLEQGLDSGQKVVVFSQYLGMIDIMERHLKKQGVDFVTLTGASQNRGEIITSFNEDPNCRVILASLKAGGTGIDLISGSVVIHYDRWWNAAKEDQATDRVHRIGQKRVVQVFKLVTQGTLEEKISAIIDRKRNLMDDVIKEDSAELVKTFNREDLLVMLTPEAF